MTPRGLDLEQLVLMDGQRVIAHLESPQMAVPGTTDAEVESHTDAEADEPDAVDDDPDEPDEPDAVDDDPDELDETEPAGGADAPPNPLVASLADWDRRQRYPTAEEARAQVAAEVQRELVASLADWDRRQRYPTAEEARAQAAAEPEPAMAASDPGF